MRRAMSSAPGTMRVAAGAQGVDSTDRGAGGLPRRDTHDSVGSLARTGSAPSGLFTAGTPPRIKVEYGAVPRLDFTDWQGDRPPTTPAWSHDGSDDGSAHHDHSDALAGSGAGAAFGLGAEVTDVRSRLGGESFVDTASSIGVWETRRGEETPLHELFGIARVAVPSSLMYKPHSDDPATVVDLELWASKVDDSVLAVMAAAGAHMACVKTLRLAGCHRVTDMGVATLIPKLRHATCLDLSRMPKLTRRGLAIIGAPDRPLRRLRRLCLAGCSGLTDGALRTIVSATPELEALDVSDCGALEDDGTKAAIGLCPRLAELLVHRCTGITDAVLVEMARVSGSLPTTSHLRRKDGLDADHSRPLALATLGMAGCTGITAAGLSLLFRSCPKVATLDLATNRGAVTDMSMQNTFSRKVLWGRTRDRGCPRLQTLSLRGCDRLTAVGVGFVVGGCTSLTRLNLSSMKLLRDESMRAIRTLVHLTDLDISGCPELTSRGMVTLLTPSQDVMEDGEGAHAAPHELLQRLSISWSGGLGGDSDLELLSSVTRAALTDLDVSQCPLVTSQGLAALAKRCTSLTRLSVAGCRGVTPDGLLKVIARCRVLEDIDMGGCAGLCDEVMFRVAGLRQLRRLGAAAWAHLDAAAAAVLPQPGPHGDGDIEDDGEGGTWDEKQARRRARVTARMRDDAALAKRFPGLITDGGVNSVAATFSSIEAMDLSNQVLVSGAPLCGKLSKLAAHLAVLNVHGCPRVPVASLGEYARARAGLQVVAVLPGDDADGTFVGVRPGPYAAEQREAARYQAERDAEARAATLLWRAYYRWKYLRARRLKAEAEAERIRRAAVLVQRVWRGHRDRSRAFAFQSELRKLAQLVEGARQKQVEDRNARKALALLTENLNVRCCARARVCVCVCVYVCVCVCVWLWLCLPAA